MTFNTKHTGSGLFGLFLLSILLLPTGVSILHAQSSGYAGTFARIGFGPRGIAMGNAMTAVAGEGIYAYYNPALAAIPIESNQFDLSTGVMSFDRSLHKVSGTFSLPPNAGLALSILNGNVSDIDGRTASGYHTGRLSTHEYQFISAFGLRISPEIYTGIGIKYNLADFHSGLENATSFGLDLGLVYRTTDRLTLGAAVRDLLSKYTWNTAVLYGDDASATYTDRFPLQADLGISYVAAEHLLVSIGVGMLNPPSAPASYRLKLGGRYRIHERITVRGGWQVRNLDSVKNNNLFSAGFSLHLPFDLLSPSVDYALVPEPNRVSSMHLFGIRLNL